MLPALKQFVTEAERLHGSAHRTHYGSWYVIEAVHPSLRPVYDARLKRPVLVRANDGYAFGTDDKYALGLTLHGSTVSVWAGWLSRSGKWTPMNFLGDVDLQETRDLLREYNLLLPKVR